MWGMMGRFGRIAGVLWTGVSLLAPALESARAQDVPKATIRTEQERTEERRKAAAAAKEAEERRLLEGKDVTFEQVLADPDNVELNLRFAKTQIRQGNVKGAQGTLERILLIAPNRADVRLLYAIVLFRLDNMVEAEREIEAVMGQDMPPSLRKQLQGYLDRIEQRRKQTQFSLLFSLGYQFDWNRNGGPGSGELETILGRAPVGELSKRRRDHSVATFAKFSVTHDLGFQALHKVFASVSYYRGDQLTFDDLTVDSISGRIGGSLDFNPITITSYFERRQLLLSNEPFINGTGGAVRVDYRYRAPINLYARFKFETQRYYGIDESPASHLRTGPEFQTAIGAGFILGADMRLNVEYMRGRKEARTVFQSYFTDQVSIDHTWLLGGGTFLLSHFDWRLDNYDDFDPFVSLKTRRDSQYRLRLTLGAPIQAVVEPLGLAEDLPVIFENVTLSVTAEAYRATSNITNFQYWNRRVGVNISKRFDF